MKKKQHTIYLILITWCVYFPIGCGDGNGDEDAGADVGQEDLRVDESDTPADPSGEEPGEDTDSPDIEEEDIEEEEIPDPSERFCKACTYDSDCAEGAACLSLEGSELSCGFPCELPTDCPEGGDCANVPESETRQCVPFGNTCIHNEIGSPCPSWGCSGRNDLCTDPDDDDGYCTHWCDGPMDCEAGFTQCEDRGDGIKVCMKNPLSPAERCGVTEHASGIGSPCDSDTCSDPVFVCATTIDASLPEICVRTCDSDDDCGSDENAKCVYLTGDAEDDKYCVSDECWCMGREPGSLLDELLDGAEMTRCDLYWDVETQTAYFGNDIIHDRFRIPWTDDVHHDWLRSIPITYEIEDDLDDAVSLGIGQVIVSNAELSGHPIEGGETTYTPSAEQPLATAVADLFTALGEDPDTVGLEADAADVPDDVQEFAAQIIMATTEAVLARNEAIAVLEGDTWKINQYYDKTPWITLPSTSYPIDPTSRKVQNFLIGDFRYELVYQAAYNIAHNVERSAGDFPVHPAADTFSFNQSTPVGRIIISDGGDTEYKGAMITADYLLVLDVGGDDEYHISAGANSSADNPVSILIDFNGEDLYAYHEVSDPNDGDRLPSDGEGRAAPTDDYGPFTLSETARQGSGRLGIGMLFDYGGSDDVYRSLRMSQGSGILGMGLLFDDGGSETFDCEAGCQGSGIFGIGILIDAGSQGTPPGDTFNAYHAAQGFAYVQAVGLLYNVEGNDTYFCNQNDVLYPSPQDSEGNSSMCQGMGFGRRADVAFGGDGVFMSGGVGIIRDLSGDDTYTAGVFGVGSGYWYGFGFLLDEEGSDTYNARWYALSGAAHFANSVLHDAAGDDIYNRDEPRRLNVTLGGGHDFSNSILIDDEGNDIYWAPNLSIGAGNDNGFGLFVDRGGDDDMHCSSDYSFGNARITPALGRESFPSIGIFLQCGGTDTYDRPDTSIIGDDRTWQQKMNEDSEAELGLGGDSAAQPCGI